MAKLLMRIVGIALLSLSIGMQLIVLALTLYDLASTGGVGFASAFGYGVTQPLAVPAFLLGLAFTYEVRQLRPVKWVYGIYFGSHLLILTCGFLFPGKFAF